ncbi:hypothetical protein LOC72_03800 [Roseiconus lacunae]|nr:hypothetical protein [Roseiconus lacunae]
MRARFYDPASGRFNRLDPFAGNMEDPQSLHKYAYVHGDPVQGVDPSGEFNALATVGAIGIRMAIGGLVGAGIGALTGGALGCVDALLGKSSCIEGAKQGAKWGAVIGGSLGGLAPLATIALPATVNAFLLNLGAGASVFLGGVGAGQSFSQGNFLQGIFRLGTSAFGGYRMARSASVSSRPINIGGTGEVPGAVNLQGRWAFDAGWFGQASPTAPAKSLARMVLEGHLFKIYNAWSRKLPYKDSSVPEVHTNSVPVDVPDGLFPSIVSSEIKRVLVSGGKWIRDGVVEYTKP